MLGLAALTAALIAVAVLLTSHGAPAARHSAHRKNHTAAPTVMRPFAALTDPAGSEVVESLAFSPDVGDWSGHTCLWNVAASRLTATLTDPGGVNGVMSVAFSPGGTTLATADDDLFLWDVSAQRLVATAAEPGSTGGVASIAFSPTGAVIATGGGPGTAGSSAAAYLWHVG